MTQEVFDLFIIGAGPAGYTAAIRAAQLGLKVACADKRANLGGTCLNVGCIPSKALLDFSKHYKIAKEYLPLIGIEGDFKLDIDKIFAKKNQIVEQLCQGIKQLFTKNKITHYHAYCAPVSADSVAIYKEGKIDKYVRAKNILIASGSDHISLPNINIDEKNILSSTGILSLNELPKKILVLGGGYIGLELGSVWNRLGSNVEVIEYAPDLLPSIDKEIANKFTAILKKQGLGFRFNSKAISALTNKQGKVELTILDNKTGLESVIEADKLLVSVGRKAHISSLNLDSLNITLDDFGRIKVNSHYQTNISSIYAVGDVISGPMLAHKAEKEAIAAVEFIAGQKGAYVDYNLIPSVIYTSPELASVGLSEEELKKKNISYKIGKFPFIANSRAKISGDTEGLVKIIADSETDKILGAHIIAKDAGSLIAEIIAYMEFGACAEDIARTCHAHPTVNEAIKEAALAVGSGAINY